MFLLAPSPRMKDACKLEITIAKINVPYAMLYREKKSLIKACQVDKTRPTLLCTRAAKINALIGPQIQSRSKMKLICQTVYTVS